MPNGTQNTGKVSSLTWDTPVAVGVIVLVSLAALLLLNRGFRGISLGGSASASVG